MDIQLYTQIFLNVLYILKKKKNMEQYIVYVYKGEHCGHCKRLKDEGCPWDRARDILGAKGVVVIEINDNGIEQKIEEDRLLNIKAEHVRLPPANFKTKNSVPEFVVAKWDMANQKISKIAPQRDECGFRSLEELVKVYPELNFVLEDRFFDNEDLFKKCSRSGSESSEDLCFGII